MFEYFSDWQRVLDAASDGRTLYYHAPMDWQPRRVTVQRRGRGRKVRVVPGPMADPFWADHLHVSRFCTFVREA